MKKLVVSTIISLLGSIALFAQAPTFSVGLKWQPNSEPELSGYRLYRGTQSGKYDWKIDTGLVTATEVSGLEPGRTYFFALTALGADFGTVKMESEYSNEVSYTTPAGEPATAPANIKAVRTLTSIKVTWDAAPTEQYVGRWHVNYAIRGKGPQPALIVTEPTVTLTTADIADVYEIFVVAEGILGRGPAAFVEVPNLPPAPIGLEVTAGTLKVVYATPLISQ